MPARRAGSRDGEHAPLVTAGLRCFNAEGTIERALRSAMGQDWPNLEILVVDDGSTDASCAVVERLAREDSRIRLVRHETNRGAARACNTILAEASGDFVAFFDDDDASLPERVGRQVRRVLDYEAATGAELVLCYASFVGIGPGGQRTYRSALGCDRTPAPHGHAVAELILIGRPMAGGPGEANNCSLLARASAFRALGGFDDDLDRLQDTDFALRAALAGAHFAGLSAPLVEKYRSGPARPGAGDKRARVRRASERFVEKHRAPLEALSWDGFTRAWLPFKFDLLAKRWGKAAIGAARLLARYPAKTVTRAFWSARNLHRYRGRFRSEP